MDTVDALDELVELVRSRATSYLRYSRGPEQDREQPSRDYEADVELPGLPVTPLHPPVWWPRPVTDWVARRVCKYMELGEADPSRRPWVLDGRIVADGPDHEPLLVDVEPIAWVGDNALTEARAIYETRFAAGTSSVSSGGR